MAKKKPEIIKPGTIKKEDTVKINHLALTDEETNYILQVLQTAALPMVKTAPLVQKIVTQCKDLNKE